MTKNECLLLELLKEYETDFQDVDDTTTKVIIDPTAKHYQLLCYGWVKPYRFVHYAIFAFQILNGKIWILENRTERDPAEDLIKRGVDRMDIVIGWIPENERQYTDYAVN